jgi:hypothetical protein
VRPMNSSLYTADRITHLKIVVVGLVAAILIAVIGISARELNLGTDVMAAQTPAVIKAGGPVVLTDKVGTVVR